jgi:flagellar protein FlaJ
MLWLVPLLVALALASPVLLAPVSRRASLVLSRVALPVFGFYVSNESPRRKRQEQLLRAAYVGVTHRVYAARTLTMATVLGITGPVFGVYLAAGVFALMAINQEAVRSALPGPLEFLAGLANLQEASITTLFVILLFAAATVGATLALGTYWLRWQLLEQKADARGRGIDATLPRMVAFVYALSRSGMPFPEVLATLTKNQGVYGEAAREVGITVRDMNAFGTNVLTALQRMSSRSPSEGMEEFSENLASVLGSGRNLSEFLREQYEQFQEEAEAQQRQYLDLLSTFAEVYVTVFVAGPLFFITVLVIVGLVIQSTLNLTRVIGYVGIPLASIGFVVYIDSMTQTLGTPGGADDGDDGATFSSTVPDDVSLDPTVADAVTDAVADGGTTPTAEDPVSRLEHNLERLALYDRLAPVREWVLHPVASLREAPAATLVVTVPVGLIWFASRLGVPPTDPVALLRAVDEPLIEASLLVMASYSVVYELKKRHDRAIEDAVPDLLDRMASVNEAGMTVVESIERVTRSDLGALTTEVQRTWHDIQWGADAQTALRRLDERTETLATTRAVTLITNAMQASGDIAPVLRIAADEAHQTRRLRRERRQEMFTYLMVIYIAFFVFLGIIIALAVAFIPAVEQAGATGGGGVGQSVGGGVSAGVFSGIGEVNTDAYSLVFFHIAAVQAVCSGVIAGQLGEGAVSDGIKHATLLLSLAYLVFIFV